MVPYISYHELNEFYALKDVCDLLKMDKALPLPNILKI